MSGDVVARAKTALEGVTDGPWRWEQSTLAGGQGGYDEVLTPGPVDCMSYCYGGTSVIESDNPERDREFIAAARSLVPELLAEVERLGGCSHDSWSSDGTGRWRCDQCGADQGSQDVGEIRSQLVTVRTELARLQHELDDAARRIKAFAADCTVHGDMTPMSRIQWNKLADTISAAGEQQ